MEPWDRYGDVVDDPDAFRAACERPLPTAVRVNPIKADPDRAARALSEEGIAVTRRAWNPHALILETDKPGRTWPYQHGWIHGQEEISQLPVRVLDPDAGDVVWDAAAAPGGKATQLAAAVGDEGTVLANDDNLGRLAALRSNADRLGVTNTIVTCRDARGFDLAQCGVDAIDGALVDAPCTGLGTVRKKPAVLDEWSESASHGLARLQEDILKRAIRLTRPGGTVVYSTCTFAPEENEAVLASVVESEDARVVPFTVALDHAPGLAEWEGESFPDEVRNLKRFYPHHNDTGGFAVAKLEVGG